ncbi:hypothetical protein [Nocardioides conyzicola]|uniref:DUF1214 domain-containing protein n=1 Tax=Nocardioides conyzicola TaxID=1651781 RepID=A0ABP8XMV0_9ACTN
MSHPIATGEQHAHELAALELVQHPTVRAAYAEVAETWLGRAKASEQMRERFAAAYEEVMFSAAVWSSNQDPLRPKVTTITRLEHEIDGRRIPGTRWGIDNPDSVYRVVPISGDERYEIRGRVGAHRMTENYFTLWDAHMGTVDVLDGRRMHVEDDGSFLITVDSDPANGRPNHVRSTPAAHELYVRDVLLDWGRDDPNAFTVERLGGAPTRPALTLDEQAQATARMMAHFADFTGKLSHGMYKSPANHFALAWTADHTGGLRNQVYVAGRFVLAPDEAFVVDVSDGGAEYFTVPLSTIWGTTLDILDKTGSLNKAQSIANEDGTYTYVISAQDPGVHNWIDTDGLLEGILTLRMAEFPDGGPRSDLSATGRVVKLDQIDGPRITPDERAAQLAERRTAYLRRLPEVTA